MSIIITEEDLCKKYAKKLAKNGQFSSLPYKFGQSGKDWDHKNDSKYHICPYNSNTRPGFRVHQKIWGSRTLSSTLVNSKLYNCKLNALIRTVIQTSETLSFSKLLLLLLHNHFLCQPSCVVSASVSVVVAEWSACAEKRSRIRNSGLWTHLTQAHTSTAL